MQSDANTLPIIPKAKAVSLPPTGFGRAPPFRPTEPILADIALIPKADRTDGRNMRQKQVELASLALSISLLIGLVLGWASQFLAAS